MNVVIADEDQGYAEGLLRFIHASEWSGRMQPAVYTEVKAFCECRESLNGALVLAGTSFLPFVGELASCCVLHLYDHVGTTPQTTRDERGFPDISKFQPLQQLLTEASDYFGRFCGSDALPSAGMDCRTVIVAVYSSSGGSGKTKVAGMLLNHLAELGGHVLGVNMESITEETDDGGGQSALQRVLFAIRDGQPSAAVMQRFIRQHSAGRIHYLPSCRYSSEWEEYTREDVAALLQLLRGSGEYRYIVVDLECMLSDRTVEALNQADRIVWLTPEHRVGASKSRFARRSLRRLLEHRYDAMYERIVNVTVPGIPQLDEGSPDFDRFSRAVLHIVSKLDKGEAHDQPEPLH